MPATPTAEDTILREHVDALAWTALRFDVGRRHIDSTVTRGSCIALGILFHDAR